MRRARLATVLVLILYTAWPATAYAHKLKLFATAIGDSIEGRVYFVGGGAALGVPVTLLDSSGTLVASTTTAPPDGTFTLPLGFRDDFTLLADAQDGHVARFSLASSRIAEALPSAPSGMAATQDTIDPVATLPAPATADTLIAIDAAVARQVAPLLAEIDALRDTIGLRDVIGGIGYVFGAFGLWALVAARRRRP